MLLRKWIKDYYTIHKRLKLKSTTIKAYLDNLPHVPEQWEYETVTPEDIQMLINELYEKGLSSSSIRHVFTIIRNPIRDGMLYGLQNRREVVAFIELPARHKKKITALKHNQIRQFVTASDESCHHDVFLMLLNTGMRFGELAGVNIGDIDIKNRLLKVSRNFYRGTITTPKTPESIREIPLNDTAMKIILKYYKVGAKTVPLFTTSRGNRLNYRSCLKSMHKVCERAELPLCGLHVLRHTFATELLRQGVQLKVISELLGHKSIAITADIYTEVPFELCQEAVARLSSAAMF